MKWVLVGAWLWMAIGIAETHTAPGERCRAGSKWTAPCFDCSCSDEGKPLCKRKPCEDAAAAADVWECEPRTSWKNDCNWCHCSDNGYALCTKRGCVPVLLPTLPSQEPTAASKIPLATVVATTKLPLGRSCLPGTKWKAPCGNTCVCNGYGHSYCTLIGCDSLSEKETDYECKSETVWRKDDCNTCICTNGKPACTRRACDGLNIKSTESTMSASTTLPPSTVSASATLPQSTLSASSTLPQSTSAPTAATNETLPIGRECAAGTRWDSQCGNLCFCGPDGYSACTEKRCEGYDTAKDFKCKPESSWRDDCNTCFCTFDGKPVCTRVACDGVAIKIPELNFEAGDREVSSSTEANSLQKTEKREKCKPGETVRRDCNTCRCSRDGSGLVCTKRGCHVHLPADVAASQNGPLQKSDTCVPGVTVQQDCNTCYCTGDGKLACTRRACLQPSKNSALESAKRRIQKRHTCTAGETFQEDCNTCYCIRDGLPTCTKVGCETLPGNPTSDAAVQVYNDRLKRGVCKPRESFQNVCNVCTCNEDGISYKCTQNECMDRPGGKSDVDVEVFMENEGTDHIERHSVCEPSSTFQINCNTCQCNYDGTDYRCSDEPCPLPDDVELFKELQDETHIVPFKKCDPSESFYDGCNKCRCSEDGTVYKCTETACKGNLTKGHTHQEAKSSRNKSIVCQANKSFQKDCNTCWCNDDGTGYFCTRKVCVPNQPDDVDASEFPEELRIIEKECRPHEVFELECNMCRCNEDGKSFSCTRRACVTDAPTDAVDFEPKLQDPEAEVAEKPAPAAPARVKRQEKPQTSSSPMKICEPRVTFRLDCNTCLCDNEGTKFSCTRLDCNNGSASNTKRRRRREVRSQKKECEPGSVFEQECNVCRCASDGQHATCTINRCQAVRQAADDQQGTTTETGFRCTPGEQFKRFCNDCTCSADGKSVFCTIKLCENEIVSQL